MDEFANLLIRDPDLYSQTSKAFTPLGSAGIFPEIPPSVIHMPPPVESFAQNVEKLQAPETSLIEKAGAGFGAVADVMAMPQQLATEALTGGQYKMPGEIEGFKQFFSMGGLLPGNIGEMLSNMVLDPLNLAFGTGELVQAARGFVGASTLADLSKTERALKVYQGFEAISDAPTIEHARQALLTNQLIFERPEDAVKLAKQAGVHVPIRFVEVDPHAGSQASQSWGFRVDHPDTLEDFLASIDGTKARIRNDLKDLGLDHEDMATAVKQAAFSDQDGVPGSGKKRAEGFRKALGLSAKDLPIVRVSGEHTAGYVLDFSDLIEKGSEDYAQQAMESVARVIQRREVPLEEMEKGLFEAYRVGPTKKATGEGLEQGLIRDEEGQPMKIRGESLGLWKAFMSAPEETTTAIKTATQIMNSSLAGRSAAHERHYGVAKEVFADIGHSQELRQALALYIDGEDWKTTDALKTAVESYGLDNFHRKAAEITEMVRNLARDSGANLKESQLIDGLNWKEKLKTITGSDDITEDLISADIPPIPNGFLRGRTPSPQDYDVIDMYNYLLNVSLKKTYNQQASRALGYMTKNVENLSQAERQYISHLERIFKGQPWAADVLVNNLISHRDEAWGSRNKMLASLSEKLLDLGFGSGERSAAQRARLHEPLVSEKARQVKQSIYAGMLGLGVDSAIRNLTQTINTITEFGIGRTFEALGAYANPEFRKFLSSEHVMEKSSSLMTEVMEKMQVHGGKSAMELLMTPMAATEALNRGVTFAAALRRNMEQGMTLADSIENAQGWARKLQFGYSNLDRSPFLGGNPASELLFQFMNFPMKQADLLVSWFRSPEASERAKGLRFLMLTGGMLMWAQKHNVDMSDILGFGMGFKEYPPFADIDPGGILPTGAVPLAEAPFIKAGEDLVKTGKSALTYLLSAAGGRPQLDQPPAEVWKGIFSIMRFGTGMALTQGLRTTLGDKPAEVIGTVFTGLTGRYAQKFSDQLIEHVFSENPEVRARAVSDPFWNTFFTGLGVTVDPAVSPWDRLTRVVGFKSYDETRRKEFVKFVKDYSKWHNKAVHELNEIQILGGDVQAHREELLTTMQQKYAPVFRRWGIPDTVVERQIKPSPQAYLLHYGVLMNQPSYTRAALSMGKDLWKNIGVEGDLGGLE